MLTLYPTITGSSWHNVVNFSRKILCNFRIPSYLPHDKLLINGTDGAVHRHTKQSLYSQSCKLELYCKTTDFVFPSSTFASK